MSLPADLSARLSLPLIAAPMFLVSGVELVVAACVEGVIGSFPTANARTTQELDAWLGEMRCRVEEAEQRAGKRLAPICPNLIVHRSNTRLADDLEVLLRHRVELVIASVGSPENVIAPLHDIGCRVFTDVASMRHAEKAIAIGSDGLVLLTAGAGGQTGWANPFAFVRAVRDLERPLVLAGGIAALARRCAPPRCWAATSPTWAPSSSPPASMAKDATRDAGRLAARRRAAARAPSPAWKPTCCGPRSRAAGASPDNLRHAATSTGRTSTAARASRGQAVEGHLERRALGVRRGRYSVRRR